MIRKIIVLVLFCTTVAFAQEQQFEVKGTISDASNKELLIGANVTYATGKGTVTDINGNYILQLDSGNYELTISYVGYTMQKQKIRVVKNMRVDFLLDAPAMREVEITTDIAKLRETPIAYTNISAKKISEELGSRDLVMVMNSTPGVYATESGGGAGDARITVRGFDQRNIAVMVDGVPVNDLENGAVFWSNWAGISDILSTTQVQRGLGASKLAVASVGGTLNMITKGIENKRMISVKQEVGNDNMFKTSVGYNSGLLKGGWGITAAGTRTTGDGFADQTWDKAWSYFLKVQKQLGKHLISVSASGAPQLHGQRSNRLPIAVYDSTYARKVGAHPDVLYAPNYYLRNIGPQGSRYNDNWGYLDRYDTNGGDTIHNDEKLNLRVNHFHKPVFNLTDYWNISSKLFLSNVLYLSYGNGGGTGLNSGGALPYDSKTGQIDYQGVYNSNIKKINTNYSTTEHQANTYIIDSHNDHIWYGLLSTLNYDISKSFTFTGGIDLRSYKGIHYQTVYDFIGGDYVSDTKNNNQPKPLAGFTSNRKYEVKHENDRIASDYYSHVKWGGLFTQFEFKKNKWSAFVTLSGSQTGYQRFDNFQKRDVITNGRTFDNIIAWGDTLLYNGTDFLINTSSLHDSTVGNTTYLVNSVGTIKSSIQDAKRYDTNSPETHTSTTNEKWYPGFVAKAGANYNLDENFNIFFNMGHLQIAPRFTSVFDFSNNEYKDTRPQLVDAIEVGYGYHARKFAANINGFYTSWKNKPYSRSANDPDKGFVNYNINGVNELHQGIELDLTFKIMRQLSLEGAVSTGDWRYKSGGTVILYSENGDSLGSIVFSAQNVHVGNAAQTQYVAGLRYEPFKGFFIKAQSIYFENYYAEFDPTSLKDNEADHDSWKLPAYDLVDVFAGYNIKFWKLRYTLSVGVFNVFNRRYISDANNGGNFDADGATVYIGQGRRFNTSLKITFE